MWAWSLVSTNILNVILVLCLRPECFRCTVFMGDGSDRTGPQTAGYESDRTGSQTGN
ncbi:MULTISPECIES: hypothetical protein [unclassified Microcoleus]|uniref:hypothetical protein n=1 Tax=unclassified Microcoleus TaxID=2642155 RepID=UPI002FCE908A